MKWHFCLMGFSAIAASLMRLFGMTIVFPLFDFLATLMYSVHMNIFGIRNIEWNSL